MGDEQTIAELREELYEARLLLKAGVEYALGLGRWTEEWTGDTEQPEWLAAIRERFIGVILDNHVPWSDVPAAS